MIAEEHGYDHAVEATDLGQRALLVAHHGSGERCRPRSRRRGEQKLLPPELVAE
jgi:hypothetical protein